MHFNAIHIPSDSSTCAGDFDGDHVPDDIDVCPDNAKISKTDLSHFVSVPLIPNPSIGIEANWNAKTVRREESKMGVAPLLKFKIYLFIYLFCREVM